MLRPVLYAPLGGRYFPESLDCFTGIRSLQPLLQVKTYSTCLQPCAVILVAVLLTVVLDTQPSWSVIAPAIFPFLSLAGVTVIALRKDYQKRIQQIANEKAERKAERQMAHGFQRQDLRGLFESPMSSDMSNNGQIDMNLNRLQAGRKAKLDNRLARLLDAFRVNPTLGISDAARALDVSRQTIYSYMDQLERSGKIRRNGHGVEVLE